MIKSGTLRHQILDAAEGLTANMTHHIGPRSDLARLAERADEWANVSGCEIDGEGDVWDPRGYWWDDEQARAFLGWLAA